MAPNEGIERIPIGRAQAGERVPGCRAGISPSRGQDHGPMCGVKPHSGRGHVTTRWTSWRHSMCSVGPSAIVSVRPRKAIAKSASGERPESSTSRSKLALPNTDDSGESSSYWRENLIALRDQSTGEVLRESSAGVVGGQRARRVRLLQVPGHDRANLRFSRSRLWPVEHRSG